MSKEGPPAPLADAGEGTSYPLFGSAGSAGRAELSTVRLKSLNGTGGGVDTLVLNNLFLPSARAVAANAIAVIVLAAGISSASSIVSAPMLNGAWQSRSVASKMMTSSMTAKAEGVS
jgi:hypothetical protein